MRHDIALRSPGRWVDQRHSHSPPKPPFTHDHDHQKKCFWWIERRGGISDLKSCSHRTKPIVGRNTMGAGRQDLKDRVLGPVEAPNAALNRDVAGWVGGGVRACDWPQTRAVKDPRVWSSPWVVGTTGNDRGRCAVLEWSRTISNTTCKK